jgi:predicted regulator of Ras-like GTPase activity (Roadblock/LC7/MglB family)
MLQRLLATFSRIDGVRSAVVVDAEMTPIATFLDPALAGVEVNFGLLEVLREAERLSSASSLTNLEQIWVESDRGNVLVAPLEDGHVILVSSTDASNIGRLRHEIRARAPVIEDLLR